VSSPDATYARTPYLQHCRARVCAPPCARACANVHTSWAGCGRVSCAADRHCARFIVECPLPVHRHIRVRSVAVRNVQHAAHSSLAHNERTARACPAPRRSSRCGSTSASPPPTNRTLNPSSARWGLQRALGRSSMSGRSWACRRLTPRRLSLDQVCTAVGLAIMHRAHAHTPHLHARPRRLAFAVYVGLSSLHESASGYSGACSLQSARCQPRHVHEIAVV
jgi:hypothetical protein